MHQEDRTVEVTEIFIDDEIISLPAKSRKIQKKIVETRMKERKDNVRYNLTEIILMQIFGCNHQQNHRIN